MRDGANGYENGTMPYLRLSSLPLDQATKRHLADELTATVLDILPDEKPEWTSVHFTPFEPGDFAIAGRLVADGAAADTHLELSATAVDERAWHALRNRLTDVIVEGLGIDPADRWHVNVKLNAYDPHSFAVAGNASDELDEDGALLETSAESRRGGGWRRPVVLVGFALGAVAGYRWFAARVGSDSQVDVAAPQNGSEADSGGPDPAVTSRIDTSNVQEY